MTELNKSNFSKILFRLTAIVIMSVLAGLVEAKAGYLYVLNDNAAGNNIYGFSVNESTGILTALAGFPVMTGGVGGGIAPFEMLTIDKANKRLYAVNDGSNTVSCYAINPSTGAITPTAFSPIPLPAGTWVSVAVHPSGSPLLVTSNGTPGITASYNITATAATAAAGSPYASGQNPSSTAISQNGSYFYAGSTSTTIAGFGVNPSNGVLSPLDGSPFATGNGGPIALATDAAGRIFLSFFTIPEVRAFTASGGIPSPVSGNPFPSGLARPQDGIVSPGGGFYLIADRSSNAVGSFRVSGSGSELV